MSGGIPAGVAEIDADGGSAERAVAFGAFVDSHRDRAVRVAWRLVGGDYAAAEDVTQDALARAYLALDGFRGEASLETWFYRILIRQAQNYRRWRAVRRFWHSSIDVEASRPDTTGTQGGSYGDPGLRRRIAQALDTLSRRQREAFVLVYMEGFSINECAQLLGTRNGTIKSHLHRALTRLRADLSDLKD